MQSIVKQILNKSYYNPKNNNIMSKNQELIYSDEFLYWPLVDWHTTMCQNGIPCGFLDSSLVNDLGQYSILGAWPHTIIEDKDGKVKINEKEIEKDGQKSSEVFIDVLDRYLKERTVQNPTKLDTWNKSILPITAGGIAYFTYDYGREFENIDSRHNKSVDMPDALITFYDLYFIEEHKTGNLFLCTEEYLHSLEWYTNELEKLVANMKNSQMILSSEVDKSIHMSADFLNCSLENLKIFPVSFINSDFEKEDYCKAIRKMKEYMCAGDIYVANMTRRIMVNSRANPMDVFHYLRTHNPSPFGAYLDLGKVKIICSSPERYIKLVNGKLKTRPIKGTRKRGASPEEDAKLRNELENSEKDKSELLMIVDLERNDLNRICKPFSVKVQGMYMVEEYATVFHLVSEITGELEEGRNFTDLIRCTFPGGSITGTPKIRCMEIIDELENSSRGLYTGSIGYLTLDGDCDMNIVIRTAVYQDGIYYIGTGGGITFESDEKFEYEETNQKAKTLIEAIIKNDNTNNHVTEPTIIPASILKAELIKVNYHYTPDEGYYFGNGVFETIHIYNGKPLHFMRHITRMATSASTLGFINEYDKQDFIEELKNKIELYLEDLKKNNKIANNVALKAAFSCGNLYLSVRENTYKTVDYKKGFSLEYSQILRNESSPFTFHKTLNYGDNIWEKRRAQKNGFDEPLFLNTKGELTEGATTNIFIVKENIIYTPSISSGLLAGIMRAEIIDYFSCNFKINYSVNDKIRSKYEIKETVLYPEDIENADQMFVTNSLLGVMPVKRCGIKEFDTKSQLLDSLVRLFNKQII